jgi:hypothetical protein
MVPDALSASERSVHRSDKEAIAWIVPEFARSDCRPLGRDTIIEIKNLKHQSKNPCISTVFFG